MDHLPARSSADISPSIKVKLYGTALCLPIFKTYPEPIGSAPPKVVSKDKFEVVFVVNDGATNLVCPAQGFPVPAFRYFLL